MLRNGWGFGFADQARFAIGYEVGQSANIGHQHGFFEMVGEGGNAALRGITVGLYHKISRTEVIFHFAVGYKIGTQDQVVSDVQLS